MPIDYNLLKVSIDLATIQANYRLLQSRGTSLIPVIKSDAYGHGLMPVGRALARCGADFYAVGTVEEAVRLRPAVSGTILALLGPQAIQDYQAVVEQDILPLVARFDQLTSLQEEAVRGDKQVPIALKFDTGMARLGFAEGEVSGVLDTLARCDRLRPRWLISHLATADEPDQAAYVLEQGERFRRIHALLHRAGLTMACSLVNSAGLLAFPELAWDLQRPGIALYGANPFYGTAKEHLGQGLRPAMQVQAPVLSVHALLKGASVSYGRTYTADADKTVAIVAAGYADNYSRGLSNTGWMLLRGQRARILGRVCMQLTAVDVTRIAGVSPGDQALLLGGEGENAVKPEELAAWWGTIPYEVFCLLGMNRREYVGS